MRLSFTAAGLLFSLIYQETAGEVQAISQEELRISLRARSMARRHGAHQVFTPKAPFRHKARRQGRRGGNRQATSTLGKRAAAPPNVVHPNLHETVVSSFYHGDNTTIFNTSDTSLHSSYPVLEASSDTHLLRSGRTSSQSAFNRTINPAIEVDLQGNQSDSGRILEFRIVPKTASTPGGPGLFELSEGGVVAKQAKRSQAFFEAAAKNAKDGSLKPSPTWDGQPSKFAPKTPYQPSSNSSTGYADILSKSLWFYQVQRSGLLTTSPRPISWRNDSGLKDGFDNNIDLTGGYYDAGDYLKFTFPLSSALTILAWGGTEHWKGIVKSRNLGYMDETLRWGLDWLMKAHPTGDTLYVQVGDGKVDNDYWGGDLTIPTPRPSFFVNRSQPGTDVAAGTAGAFAAGAIFYSTVIGDQDYAEKLLDHALSLYYFAESAPRTLYQKSVPAVKDWYASSDYADELVLAGLMLYRATSNSYFLRRAEGYFNRYKVGENRDPVDWDAKHGLCMLLGAQLVLQNNVTSKVDWLGNLTPYLDEVALKQGKTAGGLLYWPGASEENSLPPAVGMSYLLSEFARLFPKNEKAAEMQALADSQTDYVFGKNPKGNTYVVGISNKSPVNPQSAMASGGNDIGNVDHSPEVMAHVLYGGMVGGPAKDDSFQDRRSNYKQSECALDYNAPLTILLAAEIERGRMPFFLRSS